MKRATCTTVTKDREEEKKDVEVDQTTRQVADPIASVKEPQLKRRHLDEVKQVYVASDPAKVRPINDTVERDDVRVVDGNLFEASSDMALAHCVSCDMKMGRGIAREFVRRFGNRGLLLQQHKKIGEVAYLMHGDAKRPIFYMITKERYWQKPTYTSLTQALQCLVKLCQSLTIKTLAMPRIGCGLDKLKWSEVEPIIRREFKLSGIVVTVYDLPKSTVHETKKFTSDTKTLVPSLSLSLLFAHVSLFYTM
jgi:O-acetyl-ADP-ribose deacetylase (regulator of RNase III)